MALILIFNLYTCSGKVSNDQILDGSSAIEKFRANIEANRTLTKPMLDTTQDDKLEDRIVANIESKLNQNLSNAKEVLPKLSRERQAIYHIYIVETEVNNGGFDQFYRNHFVDSDESYMFDKTIEAFQLIRAPKYAEILKRANKIFKANEKVFLENLSLFDSLDKEFYNKYIEEDLYSLRIKFIRNHIDSFVDN